MARQYLCCVDQCSPRLDVSILLRTRIEMLNFLKLTLEGFIGWVNDLDAHPKPACYGFELYSRHFGERPMRVQAQPLEARSGLFSQWRHRTVRSFLGSVPGVSSNFTHSFVPHSVTAFELDRAQ
jgi:hypothetical protein